MSTEVFLEKEARLGQAAFQGPGRQCHGVVDCADKHSQNGRLLTTVVLH